MDASEPLQVAAWEHVAGTLASETLPDLATDALVRGLDSPSLRELAGGSRDDVQTSRDLFLTVVNELGIDLPPLDDALWALSRWTAKAILDGEIAPIDGARAIKRTSSDRVRDQADLQPFAAAIWELDDHPEARPELEAFVREAAVDLLSRPRPRRWIRLMAKVDRSPLDLYVGGGAPTPITPADLPLSSTLAADLEIWTAEHSRILRGWPDAGGFDSSSHAVDFVRRGRTLADRLLHELDDDYRVDYWPEAIGPPGLRLRKGASERAEHYS